MVTRMSGRLQHTLDMSADGKHSESTSILYTTKSRLNASSTSTSRFTEYMRSMSPGMTALSEGRRWRMSPTSECACSARDSKKRVSSADAFIDEGLITFWESIVVSGVAVQPSLLCCASERVTRVSLLANLLSEVHRPCIAAICLPKKKTPLLPQRRSRSNQRLQRGIVPGAPVAFKQFHLQKRIRSGARTR